MPDNAPSESRVLIESRTSTGIVRLCSRSRLVLDKITPIQFRQPLPPEPLIHWFFPYLSKVAVRRSHGTKVLVGSSPPSKRDREIPHIFTGPKSYGDQIGGAIPPLSFSFFPSYLKAMARSIPSTLGAVFLGISLAGM